MRIPLKLFSYFMVGALALVALASTTVSVSAQSVGTINAQVQNCTNLGYQGPMAAADPACEPGSADFAFYLHGDGTDESWTLSVNDTASMELQAGLYDVWTPGGSIFNVTVPENGAVSFVYGFSVQAPPPVVETATLTVNTYACTGVTGAPIALVDIGPDCTQIGTNLDFYLWGDGTDDSWNLTTSADGPVSIDLPVGGYEVVNTTSWATLGAQVPSGGGTLNIGYAAVAPAPEPVMGLISVETYACTGIDSGAIVLTDIGEDCTRVSTDLDIYMWGDGTDDHVTVTTDASGAVLVELPVGDYLLIDKHSWQRVNASVTEDSSTVAIGLPAYYYSSVSATP